MKDKRLEEYIQENREEFDFREPSPEIWNRIQENTKSTKKIPLRFYALRVAAVFAIVLLTSVILREIANNRIVGLSSGEIDPEMKELIEAEAFYAQKVDSKLEEIRKCYITNPELKDEVETDLNELEEMYKVLKLDLKENVANKTVIEAMIENNRYRLKLVDDVLDQINC